MLQGIPAMMVGKTIALGLIRQVQKAAIGSTASGLNQSITLNQTPVQGNVMILGVVSDTTVNTPSGWNLVEAAVNTTGTYMFWKLAGASESTTITVSLNSSDSAALAYLEYSGITTLDQHTQAIGGTGTTINTGTTGTTTAANELIVTMTGVTDATGGLATVTGWSNSVNIEQAAPSSGSTIDSRIDMGTLIVSAISTYTSTATFSFTESGASAIIATFK